jgi:hypothetical protein
MSAGAKSSASPSREPHMQTPTSSCWMIPCLHWMPRYHFVHRNCHPMRPFVLPLRRSMQKVCSYNTYYFLIWPCQDDETDATTRSEVLMHVAAPG